MPKPDGEVSRVFRAGALAVWEVPVLPLTLPVFPGLVLHDKSPNLSHLSEKPSGPSLEKQALEAAEA